MKRFQRGLLGLLKIMVGVGLCGMSLVTVFDATGRYFFNAPLTGSVELIELLMIIVIFGSIPLVTHSHTHIRVDLFKVMSSVRGRQMQESLTQLLSAAVSALLTYATFVKAQSVVDYGDMTQMLSIPLAPFVYLMVVLLALNTVFHFVHVFLRVDPLSETEPGTGRTIPGAAESSK